MRFVLWTLFYFKYHDTNVKLKQLSHYNNLGIHTLHAFNKNGFYFQKFNFYKNIKSI